MSDYQGKRFRASDVPDPAQASAVRRAPGRTPQVGGAVAPRPVSVDAHRRAPQATAYRPAQPARPVAPQPTSSSYSAANGGKGSRKKRRSVIPILLVIIGIGLIVAAAAIFINAQIGYKQASDSYARIESQYTVRDKDGTGVPTIDFDALAQTNPDIVGWIYVPDTVINYPVVQTTDNSKYLNTLFDGTSNASGAIFLDRDDTAPGLVDQQTTIYGHHMNDGSMFNIISDTTDQAKFDAIKTVYYITRDGTYQLTPLATEVVEDTYTAARTPNFTGDASLSSYLSEVLDGASAKAADAADRAASASKVVTLVTCRSLSLTNTRAIMVLALNDGAAAADASAGDNAAADTATE